MRLTQMPESDAEPETTPEYQYEQMREYDDQGNLIQTTHTVELGKNDGWGRTPTPAEAPYVAGLQEKAEQMIKEAHSGEHNAD